MFRIPTLTTARNCVTQRCSSSMASRQVPVIMIGKTADVGRVVEKNLKPEYEGDTANTNSLGWFER